jgi:hypothetical protein
MCPTMWRAWPGIFLLAGSYSATAHQHALADEPVTTIAVQLPPPQSAAEEALRQSLNALLTRHYDGQSQPAPTSIDEGLQGYKDAGLISQQPDVAADYNAWYFLHSAATFLDYRLLAIESEIIRGPWLGCCVNLGNAVMLDTRGSMIMVEAFAFRNGCRIFRPGDYEFDRFREIPEIRRLHVRLPGIVLLSCKELDADAAIQAITPPA